MVREATREDIPGLMDLFRQCHEASVYEPIPFDERYAAEFCSGLIAHDDALVLTTDEIEGVLIVVLTPLHFSPFKQACELVFWGEHGRELIQHAVQWASEKGALRFVIANEHNAREAAMGRWYRREGFAPVSTTYERVL